MTTINFSVTLDNNSNQNGLTSVMSFAVAGLTLPTLGITRVRVTFEAGSTEGLTITNAYIGHAAGAGDAYDFAATPVQLLFGGSGSVVISTGQSVASDWAAFAYNKTSALLVAFYCGGGTSSDQARYKSSVANTTLYYKTANDAATVDKTGYSTLAQLRGVNKIESDGDFVPVVLISDVLGGIRA